MEYYASFDNSTEGALVSFTDDHHLDIPDTGVHYLDSPVQAGAYLNGTATSSSLNMGVMTGLCGPDIVYCEELHIYFGLYFYGGKNPQYVFSNTLRGMDLVGIYIYYGILDPMLPFRRQYFEVDTYMYKSISTLCNNLCVVTRAVILNSYWLHINSADWNKNL